MSKLELFEMIKESKVFLLGNFWMFAVVAMAVLAFREWLWVKKKVRRELLFPTPGSDSFTFYFLPLQGYPSFIAYEDIAGRKATCALNAGLEYEIEEPGQAKRVILLTGRWRQESDWVYLDDLTFEDLKKLAHSVSKLPFEHDSLLASLCYRVSGTFADCKQEIRK